MKITRNGQQSCASSIGRSGMVVPVSGTAELPHAVVKAQKATKPAQAIAWKAQKRLCNRYRVLQRNGKEPGKVATAIARELSGFVWAIACAVMAEQKTK